MVDERYAYMREFLLLGAQVPFHFEQLLYRQKERKHYTYKWKIVLSENVINLVWPAQHMKFKNLLLSHACSVRMGCKGKWGKLHQALVKIFLTQR